MEQKQIILNERQSRNSHIAENEFRSRLYSNQLFPQFICHEQAPAQYGEYFDTELCYR